MDEIIEPPAAAVKPPEAPELSSFRRRFFALFLDGLILLLAGSALGMVFGAAFVRMGPWGRIVGFLVAAAYFTLLDGPPGDGRSPGKRALGIQVVDANGSAPSWKAAAIRGTLLGIASALNGLFVFGKWYEPKVLGVGLFAVAAMVTLYLTIFERRRRQGLHDVAAGTFVSRFGRPWVRPGTRNPVHAAGLAALFISLGVAGSLIWRSFGPTLEPLLRLRAAIAEKIGHDEIGINRAEFHFKDKKTTSLVVSVMYYEDPGNTKVQELKDAVAAVLLTGGYNLDGIDNLVFSIATGYNIGIASVMTSRSAGSSPADLRTNMVYRGKLEDSSLDGTGQLIRAAVSGTPEDVEKLLAAGVNPNAMDRHGGNALTHASTDGRADVVKVLISSGADVNVRDENDRSPLMLAAGAVHAAVVKQLIDAHADLNAHQGLNRSTPLIIAVDRGDAEIVKILLDAGADPNDRDRSDQSPLQYARKAKRADLADLLVKAGARD